MGTREDMFAFRFPRRGSLSLKKLNTSLMLDKHLFFISSRVCFMILYCLPLVPFSKYKSCVLKFYTWSLRHKCGKSRQVCAHKNTHDSLQHGRYRNVKVARTYISKEATRKTHSRQTTSRWGSSTLEILWSCSEWGRAFVPSPQQGSRPKCRPVPL